MALREFQVLAASDFSRPVGRLYLDMDEISEYEAIDSTISAIYTVRRDLDDRRILICFSIDAEPVAEAAAPCPNHWHCDPEECTYRASGLDRDAPCPSCRQKPGTDGS